MPQLRIKGSYNSPKGDYDAMHSFESRKSDGFGGKVHTKVSEALKNFYKKYKLNPTISSINIVMDDTNWVVTWDILIEESKDGKAYVGLTSRGGAGPKEGNSGSLARAERQINQKIKDLKSEVSSQTESKKILDFVFTPKIKGWAIRQVFVLYTDPTSYPPLSSSSLITPTGVVVDDVTNQPINGVQVESSATQDTNPYKFIIVPIDNQYEAKIYYEGEVILIKTYPNNFTIQGIKDELENVSQTVGFYGEETGNNYPPFPISSTPLTSSLNPPTSNTSGNFTVPITPLITPSESPTTNQVNLRLIKGQIVNVNPFTSESLNLSTSGITVYAAKDNSGMMYSTTEYQTKSDSNGNFEFSIPTDAPFISAIRPGTNYKKIDTQPIQSNIDFYILNPIEQLIDDVILNPQKVTEPISIPKPPPIVLKSPGYQTAEIIPYKGDGTVKEDVGVVFLKPLQQSVDEDKINVSQLNDQQIKQLDKSNQDLNYQSQKKLIDITNNIKTRLMPFILDLIVKFGISKVPTLIEQGKTEIKDIENQITCPTQNELIDIINKKNKLVKQLNNALIIIQTTNKTLGLIGTTINILNAAVQGIDLAMFALPSAIPPGTGLTVGAIHKIDDTKKDIQTNINSFSKRISGLSTVLSLLASVLAQAILYLNLLDRLVQHCYPDTNIAQEELSLELTLLTSQQSQQQSPVITNVNGFTMGVETEATTNSLKRRRATATNKQGIVMLKGEWSFSSIDQILIDELVFYIQQNNLKAD
jgi:hypothetical protein